ncbi:MAG: ABC transporter substrate-binding protein [Lautropia sp.]
MAIAGTLVSLDPPLINSVTFGSTIVPGVLQTFFNLTPDSQIEPMLAVSHEIAKDQVTWTLHLRKGVQFHDGSPWTASVAKANLDRYLGNPAKFARPQQYNFITDTVAVDDLTFQFKTRTPHSGTLHWLTWFSMAMHSGEALKKYGNDAGLHGIGTGPFKVKTFVPLQTCLLERNDAYWGDKALIQSLNVVNVPDPNGRAAIVQSGQAQISLTIPGASKPAVQANKALTLIDAPSVRIIYIGLNCDNPILADVRVRQAINYAVDADAILKNVLLGDGDLLHSVMPQQVRYYKAQKPYEYDPAKAKSLLEEAGWKAVEGEARTKDGKPLVLEIRTTDGYWAGDRATCEAVQQYLGDVGIKVDLRIVVQDAYFAYLLDPKNATTTGLNYGGYGGAIVDPTQNLSSFTSDLKRAGILGRFHRFKSPEYDAAYEKMLVSVADEQACRAAAEEAQRIAWEGAPWIFLFTLKQLAATSSKLSGFALTPQEGFNLGKIQLK